MFQNVPCGSGTLCASQNLVPRTCIEAYFIRSVPVRSVWPRGELGVDHVFDHQRPPNEGSERARSARWPVGVGRDWLITEYHQLGNWHTWARKGTCMHEFIFMNLHWSGPRIWLRPVSVELSWLSFQHTHILKNSTEEFYPHETLSTLIKLSSSLSSSIQCHVSIFNAHKTLRNSHWDWLKGTLNTETSIVFMNINCTTT